MCAKLCQRPCKDLEKQIHHVLHGGTLFHFMQHAEVPCKDLEKQFVCLLTGMCDVLLQVPDFLKPKAP